MESYSFTDLVKGIALNVEDKDNEEKIDRIVIPKIQRDYAQGRSGVRASDVRNLFSASLLATLRASDGSVQMLDFVYGYPHGNSFEPLDGQQRLTTLFLLHWLTLPQAKRNLLKKSDTNQPCLSYRTRPSARDFCKFLIEIDYDALARNFDAEADKRKETKEERPKLSAQIRALDEYRYNWDLDPTVISMLRMLDTLMDQLGSFSDIAKLNASNLDNIRFHIRDLKDLSLKQGDDLYVKMNARGLELSDFDNTKSALEADMISSGVDERTQSLWRAGIDGDWIDYFWHRAAADDPNATLSIDQIHMIEDDLKTFILRLVALHWFTDIIPGSELNEYEKSVHDLTTQTSREKLDEAFTKYLQTRFNAEHGQMPGHCPSIDFEAIAREMGTLFHRDGQQACLSVDSIVPADKLKIDPKSNVGIIDSMIATDFTNTNRLMLYGLLAFLDKFPAKTVSADDSLKADLITWMRLLRNLSLLQNTSEQFDSAEKTLAGIAGIKAFIDDFAKNRNEADAIAPMSNFIRATPSIEGFDNEIFKEEKIKEELREDAQWDNILDRFENEGYLFGQLRAPLQWAGGDIDKFKSYAIAINKFMDDDYDGARMYAALLLISDISADKYPFGDTLLTFDNNRDRSFKRYLRESVGGTYAPALKKLADIWIECQKDEKSSVGDFLEAIIQSKMHDPSIALWKRQIAQFPETIYERSFYRRIDISNPNNAYLIESRQSIKRWNINLCWEKKTTYTGEDYILHNTKEETDVKDSITNSSGIVVLRGEDTPNDALFANGQSTN
ncbi:MAG: DUF262 domain-containing protein [Clostridium sp.]|nr:DUF262 domain-containing protein [Clostridium sp.]